MANFRRLKKAFSAFLGTAVAASSLPLIGAVSSTSAASDPNYYEALAMSLYFYDSNACGSGITDGPLTWRGDCHTYDAQASVGGLDGSLKSVVDPDGDGKVDVSGGWHDAGDHIKFNLTIGFGMSSLGMSEYLNEGIYAKAGCRSHLEYEMKWGADYLMKTTFLDGSGKVAAIAGTVADGNVDHGIWTAPETQTYERPIYWLTGSKNNSAVCGEMACGLLGAAYVLKDSDAAYAAECIKYAKAILSFGKSNKGNNCDGMSFYSTDSMCEDEFALAEAWLWILGEGSKPTLTPERGQYSGVYDYYIYTWDKVWQGYAALMAKATGDSVFYDELKFELDNQGGLKVGDYNANGWGASRYNCAKQMNSYLLAKGNANSDYALGAKYQLDTILGNNSYGYSFLLGFGDKWPTHIHHRAANPGGDGVTSAQNPEAFYTNYGMLVGGIDGSGYQDHADAYQYTEGALDYNGCFAIACAFAADLYGGDASAMPALAASASEINESFVFGEGGSVVVEPIEYKVTVNVVDKETGELLPGVVVVAEAHEQYGGDQTWNTSDENPKQVTVSNSELYAMDSKGYTVYIESVPKGYVYEGYPYAIAYRDEKPEVEVTFEVTKKTEPDMMRAEIKVVDSDTNELVPGVGLYLDEEFFNGSPDQSVERVAEWNSADVNPYTFDKVKISASADVDGGANYTYTIGISALPEGYELDTSDRDLIFNAVPELDTDCLLKIVKVKKISSTEGIWGDANEDGKVTIADSVLIMQSIANGDKYGVDGSDPDHITESGKFYADVYNNGDQITPMDALQIQKFLLELVDTLDPNA